MKIKILSISDNPSVKISPQLKTHFLTCLILILFSNNCISQCPSAPSVTSPVNLCMNTTASSLTATGTSLSWGGISGTVGGTSSLTAATYIDYFSGNNKKINFTTYSNVTINTVDYFIPAWQTVTGLVLSIYNSSGTIIATSSTNTTASAGASAVKITNTFNYTISTPDNYSIGVSAGSGQLGYDNPSFPITEASGTINITGVAIAGYRCFNNIVFTKNGSSTAPIPSTATVGSTNYSVTQTVGGCTSAPATITVIVSPTGGSAPTVVSPVNYCLNGTAVPLTATGTNLLWGGALGSVGGVSNLTTGIYIDNLIGNNKKINFTTTSNVTINTVDYFIAANQVVTGLVLSIYNSAGTIIATSSTNTTTTILVASAVKITNTFNYTISTAGNYSIGVSAGSGLLGYDNPSFPITEASGTINITGLAIAGYRCFNNVVFTMNASPTAPTPPTTTLGSTNFYVTQTVSGCTSTASTITVAIAATGGSAPTVISPVNYCQNAIAVQLTATGTNLVWGAAGSIGSVGGTSSLTAATYIDYFSGNNKKINFTANVANFTINTVDYFIPANQSVTGLVLSIYNSSGTIIATSSTNTTASAGASAVKITSTFNYSISTVGNYSIGVSAGFGQLGFDSPVFPITEASGTINITGVAIAGYRCFNNLVFTYNTTSTAPTPLTTTVGSTGYTVNQTVGGCVSPDATIVVNVYTPLSATTSYSGSPFCTSLGTGQSVTRTGATGGVYSSTAGLTINSTTGAITPATSTAGIYTVTYTMNNGGCITTATTAVTITAVPSATISYTASPYCSNAGTASVTRTGTASGTYSSTIGLSINSTTGLVNLSTSTLGAYTITYTIAASGGCTQFQTTASITIVTPGTWTGAVSSNWNDGSNWHCGQIPVSTTDVIIPGGLSFYPIISTTQALHNITIQTLSAITLSSGTLQVGGSISNAGTFDASAGTIEMNGSSLQTIPANTFANNSLLNLIISNNVTLAGQQNVTGSVSFGTNNKTLTTGGYLTLKSTVAGTARLSDITNGGTISGNTILGNVTIERYIPAKRAWRLLSAPVCSCSAPTINAAWQEGVTSGNPSSGYGTQITGGTVANGFDQGVNFNPVLKIYDNSTHLFKGLPTTPGTNTAITDYPGYFLFVRGNRSTNLLQGVNAPITPTTLRIKGLVKTGNIPVNINAVNATLIGNPYPSAIDFHLLTKSNVNDKLYIWDPKIAGAKGVGGYVTLVWNGSGYDATTSVSPVSQYIPSGEAFLVESLDGVNPGTITFKETDKTVAGSDFLFRPVYGNEKLRVNLFAVNTDGSISLSDGVLTTYADNNSNTVDRDDATKLYNMAENICIGRDSKSMAIERRHTIDGDDTSFLNVYNLKLQTYKLQVTTEAMDNSGLYAVLKDKYSTTINNTALNMNGVTDIPFTATTDPASYAIDRFSIVFAKLVILPVTFTIVKATQQQLAVAVEWDLASETGIVKYELERSTDGSHFNTISTIAVAGNNNAAVHYKRLDENPSAGNNFYRIKTIDRSGQVQYSQVVKVVMGNTATAISVYPNPLQNNTINLRFCNQSAGIYTVRLMNTNGQLVYTNELNITSNNTTGAIAVPQLLAKGMYQVEVNGPGNSKTTINVIKQ